MAEVLGSPLLRYSKRDFLRHFVAVSLRETIVISSGTDAQLRAAMSLTSLARLRIVYVCSTDIPKPGLSGRLLIQSGAVFVSPSQHHAIRMSRVGWPTVAHIPHSYSAEFDLPRDQLRRKISERKSERRRFRIFLYASSAGPSKGIGEFMSAMSSVRADYELTMRVPFGSLPSRNGRILYLPNWLSAEELRERIIDSDLVVVPSLAEGFGLPILESMRLGRPVLTLDAPPMNEINREGYLVKVSETRVVERSDGLEISSVPDPQDFAFKIEEALSDPNWEDRAARCLDDAIARYNPRSVYSRFLGLENHPSTGRLGCGKGM